MMPVACEVPCANDCVAEVMTDENCSDAPVASAGAEGDVHATAQAPLVQLRHRWRRGCQVGLCVLKSGAERISHEQAGASGAAGRGEGQKTKGPAVDRTSVEPCMRP